ncbi:MAG: replicative DNA helicase [Actinomycetota bacterium]|nr:replicative DNA helicase [Actinomycetota bacterium]
MGSSAPEYDRTPPQAIEAEQSVLGAMMLSKDAIADVVELVRPGDFYRPAHQLVYDSILDLYSRGEPADAVTVSAELTRAGQLVRAGGAPYLHTLINLVPTAANAGYYAQIIAERATLRRLVSAGTRIVQMGYDTASGGANIVGSVDDVVDRAQAEIYDVTERRTSEDYVHIESLLQSTLDEIETISASGGVGTGIPTGFHQLDEITNGLHPGQMITVAGRPGSGKALAIDTPVPTPTGWTSMGSVRVGDRLLGADGKPTRVVAATEVMLERPCYEVEFSDGTVITADAEHQWRTTTRAARRTVSQRTVSQRTVSQRTLQRREPASTCRGRAERLAEQFANAPDALVSVREFVALLGEDFRMSVQRQAWRLGAAGRAPRPVKGAAGAYQWSTPVYSARALSEAVAQRVCTPIDRICAPINPARRATHSTIVTTAEIAATLRCPGAEHLLNHAVACAAPLDLREAQLPLPPYLLGAWLGDGAGSPANLTCADQQILEPHRTALRIMGVLQDKHIPARYLRASESQRRELLAGLLDTHGYATPSGTIEFGVTGARLAADFRELVVSLGYRASLHANRVGGRRVDSSTSHTVAFMTSDRVFGLDREAIRAATRTRSGTRSRYIVDVRRVASVPVRCVQVDNHDHMYLAGRTMVPTHNSTLALDFARSAAVKNSKPTVIFSLEMGKLEIMMRLFSAEAGVALQNMRSGHMSDGDWARLARRASELSEAPLFIDDSPNLTMMEIRAKARRLRQRHDVQLIIIDYLQLMTSGKRVESRQQEVSEFSRAMKLLAKELDVPVVALSQLNRGPEQRTDKKPMLADLRESGSIEQDSDMVLLVHRPDLYEPETERAGEADLIIAKHRNGPTGTIAVAFQGRYSRFADMPN